MKIALNTVILAAALVLTGCAKEDQPPHSGHFPKEGEERRATQFARAQAAVGAREDATLYAWHFDGKDLSPLGREKLAYIVEADTLDTLNIHLDVKPETFGERRKSVEAYMIDKGLAASHVKVTEGINSDTLNPAADNLAAWAKTDTGSSDSANDNSRTVNMNVSSGGDK
jgi:hypothetical protein